MNRSAKLNRNLKAPLLGSAQNPIFKQIVSLHQRKYRQRQGLFLAEGLRLIQTAQESGVVPQRLIIRADIETGEVWDFFCRQEAQEKNRLTPALFERACATENSQGLLAMYALPDLISEALPADGRLLVLDRIQDPGNMGSIIRTAEAAGIESIALLPGCTDPYAPKAVRAAMGSLFFVKLFEIASVQSLKDEGYRVVASAPQAKTCYVENWVYPKTALVLGNEANGISKEILQMADTCISIPVKGRAESLNVGAAAAVLIYRLVQS